MILTVLETWSGKKRFRISGKYFRLLETLSPVTVRFGRGGRLTESAVDVEAGAWIKDGFDYLEIETSASESVKFFVSDGEAGYDRIFTAIAQARAMEESTAVVEVLEAEVLAAGARRKVVFQSDPTNTAPIFLGPPSVNTSSPIVLYPGDVWVEETLASLSWWGVSTGANQALRMLKGE